MILGEQTFSVQPIHASVAPCSLFCCFSNGRVLLASENSALRLPTYAEVAALLPEGFVPFELAHTDDAAIFSPHPFMGVALCEGNGLSYYKLDVFRSLPYTSAALITSCWHLWSWYSRNRFCGRCGKPLSPDASERALRCAECDQVVFPMIAPAVIVAITCGDSILLAKNAHSSFQHYALIAGFVEVGETLEHAVEREVMEEVGLHVRSLRYVGNQPWGISGSQMFAFHAEATGDEKIILQKSELSDARWFKREELTPPEHTVSIAFELIERFRNGRL